MELFDIIKSFTNEGEWAKVSNTDKAKNLFMINRIMSIGYPTHAHAFNNTKIDPVNVVNVWRNMISKKYDKPPAFIYTPTNKKSKDSTKIKVPDNILRFICERYEISMREIGDLMEFYPKEFKKYCDSIKEILS